VTIETEESTVPRAIQDRRSSVMWCPNCRRQVEFVSPEQAAQIAGVSTRTIYRWVEAGTIHFLEDCGHTYVCVPALTAREQTHE
jgi:excisionase family DNA binding protein